MPKLPLALLTLLLLQPAQAATVHSLDQIQPHLRTPEAREFYGEQMAGKPPPDPLGAMHLPPALSAAAITRLVVPPGEVAAPTLVGAKPWPGQANRYVAIVCTGGAGPLDPSQPQCARSDDPAAGPMLHVYLGVIAVEDGTPPRLLARTQVDGAMDWRQSGLPNQPAAADDTDGAAVLPLSFDRFDLAPYRLAPDQLAFGLRGAWTESYSGGGAYYSGLYLFTLKDDRLWQVLAVPMSDYSDIAGDWHKDQTRDHDITDQDNVLVVSGHRTNGHFDLIVKNRVGRWRRLFRWSDTGLYRPSGD